MRIPIVQAPLAGGPSTPELAVAVGEAGGLGFLGAGYKTADGMAADVAALRSLSDVRFGVNVFAGPPTGDRVAVEAYAEQLRDEGLQPGAPHWDDDDLAAKLERLLGDPVPVVSFTFAAPCPDVVAALQAVGTEVWITVTTPQEAQAAAHADALVVQGVEAGGHRGSFDDAAPGDIGLLALLQLVRAVSDRRLIAAGGIATGAAIAAVLAAGAGAALLGSAFMLCPEAATAPAHRQALTEGRRTALTRAFTGRTARGIENAFLRTHPAAPSAYPAVHHLTAPVRRAARETGDADLVNLWAGQAHGLARELPARELVAQLWAEARAAAARLQSLTQPGAP